MAEYPIPNLSNDLSGQVALVTGTTSGLGKRFAQVIAASGAKVAITGRRVERLEALAEDIRGRWHSGADSFRHARQRVHHGLCGSSRGRTGHCDDIGE